MALNKASFSTSSIPEEVLFFFDVEVVDKNITYQCRKCPSKPRQMWKTGYSNLRKHLVSCVGSDYMEKFTTSKKAQVNPLGFTREKYITDKEFSVFRWLEWVVMRNMPLSEVDNPLKRSLAGHGSISSTSLAAYITRLVPLVEASIRKTLPDVFGIMMDGWTDVSTHYVCVIATYMENDTYREVLLGCSPPSNEKHYTAEEHYELLKFVLSVYGKSITSLSVIIGGNCATNKSLAEKVGAPRIGCGCHKLNLAVKAFLVRRPVMEKTIERVDKAVSQLRNLKAAGALRLLTPHCTLKRNVTRWSSTYKMLEPFVSIESSAQELDDIDPIRSADSDRTKEALPTLENFKSIMTDLQKQGQHIDVVHEIFQMMVEDYPELSDYLAADAEISHNPLFEKACVKIISGKQELLTDGEKA